MRIKVDPKLKPLYANLLRLGIGKYLISERFSHLCIENNVDELWNGCKAYVRSLSSVATLVPGYTGDAEDALGVFVTKLIGTGREKFLEMRARRRIVVKLVAQPQPHMLYSTRAKRLFFFP